MQSTENFIEAKFPKKMTQLRYLGRTTSSSQYLYDINAKCWKSISRMRNLQTLHIDDYMHCAEEDCIWNIKTLRHVILSNDFLGPPPEADLPNLQTLTIVTVRKSWLVEGWPKMPSIRVLKLHEFTLEYEESFSYFLSGLQHLTSLHISFHKFSMYQWLDTSSFPSYNNIQSMFVSWMYGSFERVGHYKALDICLFPIHLIKLTIMGYNFKEDPMPVIEKLKYLRKLVLSDSNYYGKQLSCSAGGFPCLEYLKLGWLIHLEEWKVEKGGMPLLKEIFIEGCSDLVAIPELQHMTRLNKLTLQNVHADLTERLQGEESYKLQHIPSITLF